MEIGKVPENVLKRAVFKHRRDNHFWFSFGTQKRTLPRVTALYPRATGATTISGSLLVRKREL